MGTHRDRIDLPHGGGQWPTRRRKQRDCTSPRLGLLDQALALDLRRPQDYFHRIWSTAFRAGDLAEAGNGVPAGLTGGPS
jgi:hypothetical protein